MQDPDPEYAASWFVRVIRHAIIVMAVLVAVVIAAIVACWFAVRPARPDAFYGAPSNMPGKPGVLLRAEAFTRHVPAGARAWLILYTTTRGNGSPAVASALVVESRTPHAGPRPIIDWAHGTSGIVPGCAPSLLPDPFYGVPAFDALLAKGWVFVATDYTGLGTQGPHPYLIGEGEARPVLDAIRAVRQLPAAQAGNRAVVWGHSQGGHAALWAGILAPDYAPDANVAGVAALAPASDLPALIEAVKDGAPGRVLSSYVLFTESEVYPDISFDRYVRPLVRPLARDMARRCLVGKAATFSVLEALLSGGSIFRIDPDQGALGAHLAQNVPRAHIGVPVLVAQGLSDDLVSPQIQARYVERQCRAGQAIDYATYAGRGHMGLVLPGTPLDRDLLRWTQARFDGAPAPQGCRFTRH